jgi:hypothetical protein
MSGMGHIAILPKTTAAKQFRKSFHGVRLSSELRLRFRHGFNNVATGSPLLRKVEQFFSKLAHCISYVNLNGSACCSGDWRGADKEIPSYGQLVIDSKSQNIGKGVNSV